MSTELHFTYVFCEGIFSAVKLHAVQGSVRICGQGLEFTAPHLVTSSINTNNYMCNKHGNVTSELHLAAEQPEIKLATSRTLIWPPTTTPPSHNPKSAVMVRIKGPCYQQSACIVFYSNFHNAVANTSQGYYDASNNITLACSWQAGSYDKQRQNRRKKTGTGKFNVAKPNLIKYEMFPLEHMDMRAHYIGL